MKPYKTLIFDIDGTLLDTYLPSVTSLRKALKDVVGSNYTDDELAFHFGIPIEYVLESLSIDNKYYQLIYSKTDEYYCQDERRKKIFKGIDRVLKILSEKEVLIGIVTSRDKKEVQIDFNTLPISKYFKVIVDKEDTKRHKPHSDPIDKFIEITNSNKAQTIYIGDTLYDCKAAHEAGIKFALATWGALNKEVDADYFLETPEDILKLI